jgi:integrase
MESFPLQQNERSCEEDFWKLHGSARRTIWEEFLSQAEQKDRAQQSAAIVTDFVEQKFVPEHVATKGLSGRTHYQAIMKHVLRPEEVDRVFHTDSRKSKTRLRAVPDWPYIGGLRLCDVKRADVQCLISAAVARGYSPQTVKHIRNAVSAIFAHAKKMQWFTGDNPASGVMLPEMIRKKAYSLTLAQAMELLGVMQYPEREMTLIAILTGMNATEISGLQWKRVNLAESWAHTDGEAIPPRTIAVRKQWHRGGLDNLGRKSRNRNLPVPAPLLPILMGLSRRPKFGGSDDFVLVNPAGAPVDEHNLTRRLRSIGKKLQMPWLSWQTFHRTHTTLAFGLGLQLMERTVSAAQPAMLAIGFAAGGLQLPGSVADVGRRNVATGVSAGAKEL